jgi:hypothetical protein
MAIAYRIFTNIKITAALLLLTTLSCQSKLDVKVKSGPASGPCLSKTASNESCPISTKVAFVTTEVTTREIAIEFSESVQGLGIDDFTVSNSTVKNIVGSGKSYRATVSAVKAGAVTIKVRADAATFLANEKITSLESNEISWASAWGVNDIVSPAEANVASGFYSSLQTITLTSKTKDATIYYTTDGSTPSTSSTKYTGSFSLRGKKTLKTMAVIYGNSSTVTVYEYTIVIRLKPPTEAAFDLTSEITPVYLPNGNIVVAATMTDYGGVADVGAVYLFNGTTGNLISALYGTTAGDKIGFTSSSGIIPGIVSVSQKYFIVLSPLWDNGAVVDAGAITLVDADVGLNGTINSSNSLVGMSASDKIGIDGVKVLSNGNFVISSPYWDCTIAQGCASNLTDTGAVTWFSKSTTLLSGTISPSNSLVGSTASDQVGTPSNGAGVKVLTNGNYIVSSRTWSCTVAACGSAVASVGAVTWGNGSTGVFGTISPSNSLVGTSASDGVGWNIVALANGNYAVASPNWSCVTTRGCASAVSYVGAVTLGNGNTGTTGYVSATNSLIGKTASDFVGKYLKALSNGNFVTGTDNWDCTVSGGCSGLVTDVGASTWVSGTSGLIGVVSTSNSLVGSATNDLVGPLVYELANGNYVVSNNLWNCQTARGCASAASQAGAVTWGSGASGVTGFVSASNSVIGTTANDQIGFKLALANGNYVVGSSAWDCQVSLGCSNAITNVGAVSLVDGSQSVGRIVNPSNSAVGSTASDQIGTYIFAVGTSNYVFGSSSWDCLVALGCSTNVTDVGIVVWASGASNVTGAVLKSQGFTGISYKDQLKPLVLSNGNYLIGWPLFDCLKSIGCPSDMEDVGVITWASGNSGIVGSPNTTNSLFGSSFKDRLGDWVTMSNNFGLVTSVDENSYVVGSVYWDCQILSGCSADVTNSGAVTVLDATKPTAGFINGTNSIVGTKVNDQLGRGLGTVGTGNFYPLNGNTFLYIHDRWNSDATTNAGLMLLIDATPGMSGEFRN